MVNYSAYDAHLYSNVHHLCVHETQLEHHNTHHKPKPALLLLIESISGYVSDFKPMMRVIVSGMTVPKKKIPW
jgi:hypothetical protein